MYKVLIIDDEEKLRMLLSKIINIVLLFLTLLNVTNYSYSQVYLTEKEKIELVEQIKKEVLDSLKKVKEKPMLDTTKNFTISAYIEPYYSYDLGNPSNHNRVGFNYSHQRHNEVNINLAFLKANYQSNRVRANLALAAGTYVNANYAAEPGILKYLFEANAGVKISKKHNLWLDAGIMPAHIGWETAIGKDNWTLTRSIAAENSPYFETGAKLTYTSKNERWVVSALILNGWQRIQRLDGNNTPAFGHQLVFKPTSQITLNSSSFIGNDKPDSVRQMRYFHNFYGVFQLHEKFGLTIGLDFGAEQATKKSSQYNTWFTPVLITKYNPISKLSIAVRGEYFNDSKGVIIPTGSLNGFKTWGYSLNLDYAITHFLTWRIEGRGFYSKDKLFLANGKFTNTNFFITSSFTIGF